MFFLNYIYFNILFDIPSYPELDLFSILSIIVIVSSSVIYLNIQENADGVCKYCVYVSVWWLDMVEANICKVVGECICYFLRIGHLFFIIHNICW